MKAGSPVEQTLSDCLARAEAGAPPLLSRALWHAVFPGGARLRPRLTLAVAQACGLSCPELSLATAAAIELLHCASLCHDDLPCFDDADVRRGLPSVHRAFGEPLAVLAGDALIVLAFETLARAAERAPSRLPALVGIVARSVGMPNGIVAGQAWECEPFVELEAYHRAKTGELFAGATAGGAASSGHAPEPWRLLGERLGEAYQVADDLRDVAGNADDLGKPTGRDKALGRRNAVAELGLVGAVRRFDELIAQCLASIPPCDGAAALQGLIRAESRRFVPKDVARLAA